MIQIRNVPPALHRQLKSRAALAGMSLSDYLLGEIREIADKPSLAEMAERLRQREAASPRESPIDIIRAQRDQP